MSDRPKTTDFPELKSDFYSEKSPDLEREALAIWREREKKFPAFVRRMNPDALDRITGAWDLCLWAAYEKLNLQGKPAGS